MNCGLGVDIGGTKIEICRLDEPGIARHIATVPTAQLRRGTTAFADDLAELIRTYAPPNTSAVGVSINALVRDGKAVYSSLMGGAVEFELHEFLSSRLGIPVSVDDDIHAMTLAERLYGAGHDTGSFAMLNIGTGVGVGCFADDHVLRGRYGAGLISEITIHVEEFDQERTLDRTVSGRGIKSMYRERTGRSVEARQVFANAREGEVPAERVIGAFADALGLLLAMISRFYHPERIVINGSIRNAADVYLDRAVEAYHRRTAGPYIADVVVSDLDFAAELGVAALSQSLLAAQGPLLIDKTKEANHE